MAHDLDRIAEDIDEARRSVKAYHGARRRQWVEGLYGEGDPIAFAYVKGEPLWRPPRVAKPDGSRAVRPVDVVDTIARGWRAVWKANHLATEAALIADVLKPLARGANEVASLTPCQLRRAAPPSLRIR